MDCFFLLEKDIDSVRINFENCEQIEILTCDIIKLSLGTIHNDKEYISVDNLNFVINPNANLPYTAEWCPLYSPKMTTFDRIFLRSDIVSTDIHKKTGEHLELWVPYKENEKGFNSAEKCYIGKNGELHIEIKM